MRYQTNRSAGFRPALPSSSERTQSRTVFRKFKAWHFAFVVLVMGLGIRSRAFAQQPFAGCVDQFWNGTPPALVANGSADALCAAHFATLYSEQTETPLYSAEHLTPAQIKAAIHLDRVNAFHEDDRLPPGTASTLADYRHSPGIDRGHMAPSGDEPDAASQLQSFALSNVVPQNANDNRNLWAGIEFAVRELVLAEGDEVYVVTGPIFGSDDPPALHGRVEVPMLLFKAVYDETAGIAGVYVARNASGWQFWRLSLADFRNRFGIDAFPGLQPNIEADGSRLPKPLWLRCSHSRGRRRLHVKTVGPSNDDARNIQNLCDQSRIRKRNHPQQIQLQRAAPSSKQPCGRSACFHEVAMKQRTGLRAFALAEDAQDLEMLGTPRLHPIPVDIALELDQPAQGVLLADEIFDERVAAPAREGLVEFCIQLKNGGRLQAFALQLLDQSPMLLGELPEYDGVRLVAG